MRDEFRSKRRTTSPSPRLRGEGESPQVRSRRVPLTRIASQHSRSFASAFALSGAVLTYFGFMHGEAVGVGGGLGVTTAVALAYAVVAAGFFAVGKYGTSAASVSHPQMPLAAPAE